MGAGRREAALLHDIVGPLAIQHSTTHVDLILHFDVWLAAGWVSFVRMIALMLDRTRV